MLRHPGRLMARALARALVHDGPGVRVQITDPRTGDLLARVPAVICAACGDVVLAGVHIDVLGRCACCVLASKEQPA